MKFFVLKSVCGAMVLLAVLACSSSNKCRDNETIEIEANMFIQIPGGRFRMGLEEGLLEKLQNEAGWLGPTFIQEIPAHEVEVAPFQISKTPVTNAEYAEFVNAGGYEETRFWEELWKAELEDREEWKEFVDSTKTPGPPDWKDGKPLPGKELHPVNNLNWYEASAYCAFKGWRLPTEAEWEFAARGTDGRIYPWGNEFNPCRCTTSERNGIDTVPVNTMPGGQSPFGVLHMSGNVAEWVADLFRPYPGMSFLADWYETDRVTRNTWGGTPELLRASVRVNRPPNMRHFGFRCAKDMGAP